MKIKIVILSCLLFLLQFKNLTAQSFILYGDKTFGGNWNEALVNMTNAGNNQFILAGSSATNVNGDKTDPNCNQIAPQGDQDIWILKIDTGFNIIWDKSLGGNLSELQPFLIMTGSNKQMIFSCLSPSDSACEKSENNRNLIFSHNNDYWVCMIDSNGNKIWDKTLGGTNSDDYPHIIELTTGDFIVCGESDSPISADKTVTINGGRDYWAVKLDAAGHIVWDKVYGGTGNELSGAGGNDWFNLLPCEDGGFILGGTTTSPAGVNISDSSRGLMDIWIIKLDNDGNQIWDKRYGGTNSEWCQQIISTNDGGYMVCGQTQSQQGLDVSQPSRGSWDAWLIKLDSLGNKQWDKRYGGNKYDAGYYVSQAPGGGYWVSGSTSSDSGFEVTEPNYGTGPNTTDYWIFKTDSAGNKLWDKRFGGPGGDQGSNFVIMPDSSIYLFGYADSGTSAVKTDAGKGGLDYWLVHFKYGYTFTGVEELAVGSQQLAVVPNPAKENVEIRIQNVEFRMQNLTLTLYDITGRVLLQQPFTSSPHHLVTSSLRSGVYIVEVKDKEGRSVKGKLVKD